MPGWIVQSMAGEPRSRPRIRPSQAGKRYEGPQALLASHEHGGRRQAETLRDLLSLLGDDSFSSSDVEDAGEPRSTLPPHFVRRCERQGRGSHPGDQTQEALRPVQL